MPATRRCCVETIRAAKKHGVAVGAHPGFPDLVGFGRRELNVSPAEAEDFVLYQVAAVAGVAAAEGVALQHVKPHGALFNMAVRDAALAAAIARGVAAFDKRLILFGLPGSEILKAGARRRSARRRRGVCRPRLRGGRHAGVPRKPGTVIHDADTVVARAVRMVTERSVVALDGSIVALEADTMCVHGDTPGSDELAARIRARARAGRRVVRSLG